MSTGDTDPDGRQPGSSSAGSGDSGSSGGDDSPRQRRQRLAQERHREGQQRHREAQERRGRKGPGGFRGAETLSTGQVVRAGLAVADAEGPQAVTMRRIAVELGVGTMSLYWHVDDKEQLLDLMLDAVQGEIEMPDPPSGDWRADLRTIAHNTRAVLHRHPWMGSFIGGQPPSQPNFLRHADLTLAALDGLGVPTATMVDVAGAVDTYVIGFVLRELRERETRRGTDTYDDEESSGLRSSFPELVQERYPRLARLLAEGVDPEAADKADRRFEFGLESMLDGIAARVDPSSA